MEKWIHLVFAHHGRDNGRKKVLVETTLYCTFGLAHFLMAAAAAAHQK
jgi:hypothetical protein